MKIRKLAGLFMTLSLIVLVVSCSDTTVTQSADHQPVQYDWSDYEPTYFVYVMVYDTVYVEVAKDCKHHGRNHGD